MKLKDYLLDARKKGYAIGHFNFATGDVLRAIIEASKEAGAPAVMIGTSEGEADFVGINEAVALVKALRADYNFPVFLNADHFKSFDKCREAIDAGYDSVIIDTSKMEFKDNMSSAKKVVEYAKSISASRRTDISVEGELGYLKGSSEVQQKVEIGPDDYTKLEEAKDFVGKTGVDRLAIVFGNIHGIVTEQEERLDVGHLKKIVAAVPDMSYVLHGASGLKDEDVVASIKAGINNVHFNTELRVAYHDKIRDVLQHNPNETTPYKYLKPAVEEVKKVVSARIKLFMGT